jgi:hypothetical protein
MAPKEALAAKRFEYYGMQCERRGVVIEKPGETAPP